MLTSFKKFSYLITFTLTLWASLTALAISQNQEELKVLKSILENSKYPILKNPIRQEYIDQLDLDLSYFNILNPCKYELEKNTELLTREEIIKLNAAFKELESFVFDFDSPNLIEDKNESTPLTTSITIPVFFRNGKFAAYYSEQRYGGQMNLLKKENNKWVRYCSYSVWIE
jgi:hypothetical protein